MSSSNAQERLPLFLTPDIDELARCTALRLIEWCSENPRGVLLVDTGRVLTYTALHFERIMTTWHTRPTQTELESTGLGGVSRPELSGITVVQGMELLDRTGSRRVGSEFMRLYFDGGGFRPERAITMDLRAIDVEALVSEAIESRRGRPRRRRSEAYSRLDAWCAEYDRRIHDAGGVGLSVFELGVGGAVFGNEAFDSPFTSNSETRLVSLSHAGARRALSRSVDPARPNARKTAAVTIGLETLCRAPAPSSASASGSGSAPAPSPSPAPGHSALHIALSASAAERETVANLVSPATPVSSPVGFLRETPHSRVYATETAGAALRDREVQRLRGFEAIPERELQRAVIDIATSTGRPILELSAREYRDDSVGRLLMNRYADDAGPLNRLVHEALLSRISGGLRTGSGQRILHIEPNPCAGLLNYLPWFYRESRNLDVDHRLVVLSLPAEDVSNDEMLDISIRMLDGLHDDRLGLESFLRTGDFASDRVSLRQQDTRAYLDGVARGAEAMKDVGRLRRFSRDLAVVFSETDLQSVRRRVESLVHYFERNDGAGDSQPEIRRLRELRRRWTVDCVWSSFGHDETANTYMDFALMPTLSDMYGDSAAGLSQPSAGPSGPSAGLATIIRTYQPDVIVVPLEADGGGPAPHYEAFRAIGATLGNLLKRRIPGSDRLERLSATRVVGFRPASYRYHPAEADICVPVSLHDLSAQRHLITEVASFPDPVARDVERAQVEQYGALADLLGPDYFREHSARELRAARGFVFLKDMSVEELIRSCSGPSSRTKPL